MATSAALLLSPTLAASSDADDLSARELAEQAKDTFLDAQSVRLKLADRSASTISSKTAPTFMDLFLDRDGNCVGTLELGANGGSLEIVRRGEEVWLKPDTAFWKAQLPGSQGDTAAEFVRNRYIRGSSDDALLKDVVKACDLDTYQEEFGRSGLSSDDKSLTKGEETTVDGAEVVPLKGEEDGKPSTLYVTSDRPHRLVAITQKADGTDTKVTFSDYDEPVPSQTPSADESVDVDQVREELLGG
ncbi:hypothetical protein GCM10010251_15080 [Streptomyces aurantiogriseus]|uniref:Lipoprotein n=1 Tax=Streptomyces aurantiogriseus TaxID=66870 RepID=A0A918C1Q1_9ACTN|nr:hypothetical protein GCM10010251_15080 [Streptomyces aurantiogriseus]